MRQNQILWSVIAATGLGAAQARAQSGTNTLTEGGPHNGLSSQAFRENALITNYAARTILLTHPLDDAMLGVPALTQRLNDPGARAIITELVSCALTKETTVGNFQGELGLCQRWHTTPLAQLSVCQEVLTACVMARVNARGMAVPISLRGAEPGLTPLRAQIGTRTHVRESPPGQDPSQGWPIESFLTCPNPNNPNGECGWSTERVWKCQPGAPVSLFAEGPACGAVTLRACTGLQGCYASNTGHLLPDGNPFPAYARALSEQASACPTSPLSLQCPADGYFNVMERAADPEALTAISSGSATHNATPKPASERQLFPYAEGAFYGNLFTGELRWTCEWITSKRLRCSSSTTTTLPYEHVYACYAPSHDDDSLQVMKLNDRLCAAPGASCFPHPPAACQRACTARNADGAFGSCKGPNSAQYHHPVTTYLSNPCDLVNDARLRVRLGCPVSRNGTALTQSDLASRPREVPPAARGCRGCSIQAGRGGPLVPLGAALWLLLRRRRPRPRAASAPVRAPARGGARLSADLRQLLPGAPPTGASRRAPGAPRRPPTTPLSPAPRAAAPAPDRPGRTPGGPRARARASRR